MAGSGGGVVAGPALTERVVGSVRQPVLQLDGCLLRFVEVESLQVGPGWAPPCALSGGQCLLSRLLLFLPLMQHCQLLDGDNTQQMTWRCIGVIHQAHLDGIAVTWFQAKVRQGETFAGA